MGALKLYQEEAGLDEQERVADIFTWDDSPREFRGVEGPRGSVSYREAVEASRFCGRQLAQVLSWLVSERPGVFGTTPSRADVWGAGEIGLELEGVAEILRGLGEADLESIPANTPSIFCALSTVTKGLAMRLNAVDDGAAEAERATVTIGRTAPVAEPAR